MVPYSQLHVLSLIDLVFFHVMTLSYVHNGFLFKRNSSWLYLKGKNKFFKGPVQRHSEQYRLWQWKTRQFGHSQTQNQVCESITIKEMGLWIIWWLSVLLRSTLGGHDHINTSLRQGPGSNLEWSKSLDLFHPEKVSHYLVLFEEETLLNIT